MKQIIILNGPPGSGKDTIAGRVAQLYNFEVAEFKAHLHNIAILLSGLTKVEYFELYNNRELKETKTDKLLGYSPRDFLIHISEVMCRPAFGKDYFGIAAAKNIAGNTIFSDGGFPDEVNVLKNIYGAENVHIIHLSRRGCSFIGDSRRYILEKDTGITPLEVSNDGSVCDAVYDVMLGVVNRTRRWSLLRRRGDPF